MWLPVSLFGCFGGGAALLLQDLTQADGEAGDGCEHGAENLGVQTFLAVKLCQGVDLVHGKDSTLHESGLDLELAVHLGGVFIDHADGSDGVLGAGGQRSGSVQDGVELLKADLVECETNQGVLYDGVLHALFTQLAAEIGMAIIGSILLVRLIRQVEQNA